MENNQSSEFDIVDLIDKPDLLKFKHKDAIKEQALIFAQTFNTEQGQKALNILSYRFFSQDCFSEDYNTHKAAERSGQQKLMKFIYEQIQVGQNG